MTMTETATEPGVFGEFDSIAAIMGFIHHTSGDEGLAEMLATIDEPDRESFERYAGELEKVGLTRAAELVREAAKGASVPTNPHPEGSANARDWDRRNRRVFKGFQITDDTAE